MKNIKSKDRIIVISGKMIEIKEEVIKILLEEVEKYCDKKFYIIIAENEFIRNLNYIIELIKNIDNKGQLEEILKKQEMIEFFKNEDYRDIVIKTILKLKSEHVNLSEITVEQIFLVKLTETVNLIENEISNENGEENYDLIINTSYSSPSDIVDVIIQCEKCDRENKDFSKHWASPKMFLPLQSERDTVSRTIFLNSIDELIENIQISGYYPDEYIDIINVDGYNYIIDGHHRNFASAYLGRTLVPYKIIGKGDEVLPKYMNTARQRANTINLGYLYGHEWLIRNSDSSFEYSKMFPELYKKLKQEREEIR